MYGCHIPATLPQATNCRLVGDIPTFSLKFRDYLIRQICAFELVFDNMT